MWGFDKGGGIVRFTLERSGTATHLIGCFEGAEISANIDAFLTIQTSWIDQFKDIQEEGIIVDGKFSPIQLVVIGDKAAIAECLGHQGSSATFPILYDETTSAHLRKSHRDGSPHAPGIPGCTFPRRTLSSIDEDFLENKKDSRNKSNLRLNGKYHKSIVGPRLLNLASLDDVAVSILHIWLSLGLILTRWVTLKCKIMDGNAATSELQTISLDLDSGAEDDDEDEENEEEEEEEEEEGDTSDVEENVQDAMTPEMIRRRLEIAEFEASWTLQAKKVADMEADAKMVEEGIEEKTFLKTRIYYVLNDKAKELEGLVKKRFKGSRSNRRFKSCSDMCLLTKFDLQPATVACTTCQKDMHLECGLFKLDEETGDVLCHSCSSYNSKQHLEEAIFNVTAVINEEMEKVRKMEADVNLERLDLQQKEACVKQYIGPHEREFERILEEEIGVARQEHFTGCWVGNHIDKIIRLAHLISPVLADLPEDRENYDNYVNVLKRLHPLTKARRFLSEEELDEVEQCCTQIGHLYPKTFKPASITPKVYFYFIREISFS